MGRIFRTHLHLVADVILKRFGCILATGARESAPLRSETPDRGCQDQGRLPRPTLTVNTHLPE